MEALRFNNIDIARGLAMLVIIEWHTLGFHCSYTDGWAMPIFFFIMGIFYKQPVCLRDVVLKKAKGLLIPLLAFSFTALIIALVSKSLTSVVKQILNPYVNLHGVAWFLLCTFWCYIISYLVHKYIKSELLVLITFILISVIGYYTGQMHILSHRVVLPFYFSTAMTAIGFLGIGEICKKYILSIQDYKFKYLSASLLAYWGGVIMFSPQETSYIWNTYGNSYISLLYNGVAGSVFIISLSNYLSSKLSALGKYSLLLLLIHPYMIMIFSSFLSGWILYSAILVSSIILSLLCGRYLPTLSGLKK